MHLVFLGTASCYPTAKRGVSCTALRLENGNVWIFDCGEGSQIQLQKTNIRPGRITKIFITHLHGDHLFGLPGLLCTLGNQVQDRPTFVLEIFGPQGIRRYVRESLNLSRSQLPFDYVVHELIPQPEQYPDDWDNWGAEHKANENKHIQEILGRDIIADGNVWNICKDDGVRVSAGSVVHRVPTFGFVLKECDTPGRLNVDLLTSLGVPPGPLYSRLKKGEVLTLPSGTTIQPSDVLGSPKVGRKIVILGDTSDAMSMSSLALNCDVLIHETTLENSMIDKAKENGHSTPSVAGAFARHINAQTLVIYHFSQRYKAASEEEGCCVDQLLNETREALDNCTCHVIAARDFLELAIPRPNSGDNTQ